LQTKWSLSEYENPKRYDIENKSLSDFPFLLSWAQKLHIQMNGFQHFLTNTDQDQLLTSIHHVLAENGIFIFDTRFPSKEELIQPSAEEYWTTISDEKGRKCDLYTEMIYDSIQQIQHYITTRRFYEDDVLVEELKTTIDLRYTYPQELERLLVANGFELLHIYNDWEGNELGEDCYSMVVVCRKKK